MLTRFQLEILMKYILIRASILKDILPHTVLLLENPKLYSTKNVGSHTEDSTQKQDIFVPFELNDVIIKNKVPNI